MQNWVFYSSFIFLLITYPSFAVNPSLERFYTEQYLLSYENAEKLLRQGEELHKNGYYRDALEIYQQALALHEEAGEIIAQANVLQEIGRLHYDVEKYTRALVAYQMSLLFYQKLNRPQETASTLNIIGTIYQKLENYKQALEYYQRALVIWRNLQDAEGEGITLNNVGIAYQYLGMYPQAMLAYQQALSILKQENDSKGVSATLNQLGTLYLLLGDYEQSLEFFQRSLEIRKQNNDKSAMAENLNNIGLTHTFLGHFSQARTYYQEALENYRAANSRTGEAITLNNIGLLYISLKQNTQALTFLESALTIQRELGRRKNEGATLDSLATAYRNLGQINQAWELYQQSLAILREVGNRQGEARVLSNIGLFFDEQNQVDVAIIFYKQFVNVTEGIRQDIRSLERALQETYTGTIADRYRRLADLLLSQGRILEAQQVLELLKVEELREFTNTRASVTTNGIAYTATEQAIIDAHNNLIAFGQQINTCEQSQCNQLNDLLNQRDALTQEFGQTLQVFTADIQQRRTQDRAFLDPEDFTRSAIDITDAEPGTVLVYPFVLEDKLWLLWATSGGVVNSIEVPVNQQQLGETVLRFRQLLSTPNSQIAEVQTTAKQLYDWLIAPLQPQLQAGEIRHLVFSLDRVTRYIPMAALFDGEHYLIENYTVSTVLSNDLTDLSDRTPFNPDQTSVLAMGLSDAVANFNPLPHVPSELDAIVQGGNHPQGVYPGQIFLNRAFDRTTLRNNVSRYPILHVATHGVFVPGRQDESYLLLGTGEQLKIPELQTMQQAFSQVRMVVLSACETALGEPDQDGIEIAGMAYYFLNSGTNTVMASLWSVDDASTTELMQQFYQTLATGTIQTPVTRSEALQQAQLRLLHSGSGNLIDAETRSIVGWQDAPERDTDRVEPGFSHPYYWAPFILIGNGL